MPGSQCDSTEVDAFATVGFSLRNIHGGLIQKRAGAVVGSAAM